MFDFMTRPIRALFLVLQFRISYAYAYAVLDLEDQQDAGTLTDQEYAQAGLTLAKQYPNDVQRIRNL